MEDTFIVVSNVFLTIFVIYTISERILWSAVLTWIHIILTLLGIAFSIVCFYRASEAYVPGFDDWEKFKNNDKLIISGIMLFIISQALLMINIITGIATRRKRKSSTTF